MFSELIAVHDDAELLNLLRESLPRFRFVTDGAAAVTIVGAAAVEAEAGEAAGIRILLDSTQEKRDGDLRLSRTVFLESSEEILAFALQAADALARSQALETELESLGQVQELMSMADAAMVSEKITRTVLGILGLSRGTLLLHDPRLERYLASFTNDPMYYDSGDFLPGVAPGHLQTALEAGSFAMERKSDGSGMIVMALQVADDLVGVIRVPVTAADAVTDSMRAEVSRYLSVVVRILGNLYQITRSNDLAMRDDLTRAYNRRFFDSYLDEEIERARRYRSVFSVIFLDLDELRMVNSKYGHLAGSRTLQEVAKRIMAAVRGIDKVIRFGGDEFCIILPQTDSQQAVAVATRVRKSIAANSFKVEGGEVFVTASFGIATYPTHAMTKEDLIKQADAAMYEIKQTTKNAVGVALPAEAIEEKTE